MSSVVMDKVIQLIKLLKKSSVTVFSPNRGFRLHSSQEVQHLNPACRAARAVPHLNTALLLFSLMDYDIPKSKPMRFSLFGYTYEIIFWMFVAILVILIAMPDLVKLVLIESSMTTIVKMIYFTIFIGEKDIFVSFCLGTGLIMILFFLAECFARRARALLWR